MLKRTLATAFSVAFAAAILVAPIAPAYAEMAAPNTKQNPSKKDSAKKSDSKSGMTGAERRKKCSEEWQAAKAAGKTANQKWPQFYSACNTRLKGG
jgi:uncharacterized low-complexity protein